MLAMDQGDIHVKRDKIAWIVQEEGADCPIVTAAAQKKAWAAALTYAESRKVDAYLHDETEGHILLEQRFRVGP